MAYNSETLKSCARSPPCRDCEGRGHRCWVYIGSIEDILWEACVTGRSDGRMDRLHYSIRVEWPLRHTARLEHRLTFNPCSASALSQPTSAFFNLLLVGKCVRSFFIADFHPHDKYSLERYVPSARCSTRWLTHPADRG